MFVYDVSNLNPLLDNAGAKLFLAIGTEILYLGLFRTTDFTEIVKENVNLEVLRQNFSFILPDVLRAQFHFSRMDVVASLDKTSVEHDATERSTRKALMPE